MLIRNQLRLVGLLPAVIALTIGGVLWIAALDSDQAHEGAKIAVKPQVVGEPGLYWMLPNKLPGETK